MSSNVPNTNLQTFAELYAAPAADAGIKTPQAAAPNIVNDGAVDNKATTKGDTITFAGKQINKKKAIIGGAVILATVAGIATLAIKGKFGAGKIGKEVETLTKEANELAEEAQKTIDNVMNKFNQIINNDKTKEVIEGNLVEIAYDTEEAGRKALRIDEFTEDGKTLLRKSVFNRFIEPVQPGETQKPMVYVIDSIEEFNKETGKYNVINMYNGKIEEYIKNIEDLADGGHKADQYMYFFDAGDNLCHYHKNVELSADIDIDKSKSAQQLELVMHDDDMKPDWYTKNYGANKEKYYEPNENGKWKPYKPEKANSNNFDEGFDDDLGDDIFDD